MNIIVSDFIGYLNTYVKEQRGIKTVYEEDPLIIPAVSMPALIVSVEDEGISTSDNLNDNTEFELMVTAVFDSRHLAKIGRDYSENAVRIAMRNLMSERNDDMTYKDNTIVSVLRKHLYNNSKVRSVDNIRVAYGVRFRQGPDTFTHEAQCSCLVRTKQYERNPS